MKSSVVSSAFYCISFLSSIAVSYPPSRAAAGWQDIDWDFIGKEHDLKVDGTVPSFLSGSLYRNGPAIWRFGDETDNPHWFEGLGFLEAFHFNNGQVSWYSSFVNSTEYQYYDPNDVNFTNQTVTSGYNSQVTIRKVNGNLLANDGNPWSNSFDPITTQTLQHPYIYDDAYMNNPIYDEDCPSHAQIAPNGDVFQHIVVFGGGTITDGYYQQYYIKNGTNERIMAPHKIKANSKTGPMYQHMDGLTEHYSILCEQPFALQNRTWMPEVGLSWYVVDKYTGELVATFYSDPFFVLHWANSYEVVNDTTGEHFIVSDIVVEQNGSIYDALYINSMIYDWEWSADIFCTGNFSRFILPLNRSGEWVSAITQSEHRGVEMPVINYDIYNTKEYQYAYMVGLENCNANDKDRSQFWDTLVKTEVSFDGNGRSWTWSEDDVFVAEPIFAGRKEQKSEDDGVLLSLIMDANTNQSSLLILDAQNMKELARVTPSTINTIPFGFHGRYYD